ncbi:hypothetical protein BJX64DRAFT_267035 [Aspergillus heterothallicus]
MMFRGRIVVVSFSRELLLLVPLRALVVEGFVIAAHLLRYQAAPQASIVFCSPNPPVFAFVAVLAGGFGTVPSWFHS